MANVKKYGKLAALALAVILPLVATVACSSLKPAVDQGIAAAQKVSTDAQGIIDTAKSVATTLPIGSADLKQVNDKIAQVQAIKDQADQYIKLAQGVEASLGGAAVDPTTASALGLLPYGSYVVAGLSLLAALKQRGAASSALDDLTNVVKSWQAIGAPLNDVEKAAVAAIQGQKTSATVDAIKQNLTPAA